MFERFRRCRSRLPTLFVVMWIMMGPGAAARAQTPGASGETSALDLNRRSAELYRQGRYAEAIALLREAYRRKPEPVIQYNLARACEMMEDYACAITAYEAYVSAGHPPDRAAIEARIARCRTQLAAQRARPRTPPPPPPAPPPRSILPPIVGAVGVVGVGVGLALASAARARHDEAVLDPTQTGAQQKQERAESLMRSANLTLIAGGVVAAAGLTWWIVDIALHREPRRSTTALQVGPGSVAVSVAF